jgi:GH24 family phage-related lysozyme (muramidase)
MDGGRVIQGLVNRRADEKRVFLLVSTGANDV